MIDVPPVNPAKSASANRENLAVPDETRVLVAKYLIEWTGFGDNCSMPEAALEATCGEAAHLVTADDELFNQNHN